MQRKLPFTLLILLSAFLLVLAPFATAGTLYRWVDSDGKVHYSDKVPPEEVDKARTLLNERGLKIDSVGRARSPEEIARDKELARMRVEQRRLIEEQKAADRVLLRTFRSEDDIKMTLNGKLTAIDVQIQVIRSNIKRMKQKLGSLQKGAAALERQGRRISKNFLKDIGNTRAALKDGYASIVRSERRKESYREKYGLDLDRFRKLKHLSETSGDVVVRTGKSLILDLLYRCDTPSSCDWSWTTAETFVREFATTKLQMLSESIIMTAVPVKDDDISITVARIRRTAGEEDSIVPRYGAQLFLDVQCKSSPLGMELCKSDKVEKIRTGFKKYLARAANRSVTEMP